MVNEWRIPDESEAPSERGIVRRVTTMPTVLDSPSQS